ncbi:MAG: transposase [Bacteroidota bacterium]|nr:transposase [Bacteroidota bacterium]
MDERAALELLYRQRKPSLQAASLREFAYQELLHLSNELRAYVRKAYKKDYYLLRCVPGIEPLTSIALQLEVGALRRFSSADYLCSYVVGLVPCIYSRGETIINKGLPPEAKSYSGVMGWKQPGRP